jgi:hypothetical protein
VWKLRGAVVVAIVFVLMALAAYLYLKEDDDQADQASRLDAWTAASRDQQRVACEHSAETSPPVARDPDSFCGCVVQHLMRRFDTPAQVAEMTEAELASYAIEVNAACNVEPVSELP